MKDIDFDELDRAVTSALSASGAGSTDNIQDSESPAATSTPTPEEANTEAVTSTQTSISSHAVHARLMASSAPSRTTLIRKPVAAAPSAEADAFVEETQAPETAVPDTKPKRTIPHREGRFMDVVYPGNKTIAPSPVSERLTPPAVPQSSASESAEETHLDESHNASLEAEINNLFVNEGHEPIVDTANVDGEVETATPGVTSPSEPLTASQDPTEEEVTTDAIASELSQPLEDVRPDSPFIADAKVEKRPLGGLEPLETNSVDYDAVDALDLTPKINDTPGAPVPEELASDLTAIESQETSPSTDSPISANERPKTEVADSRSEVAGPTSIARQYKEQPRTASEDDEAGAIFDPQTYQPPVEHPAKKSSGWGWVVACVLIIVLATIAGIVAWMEGVLPVPL